MTSFLRRLSILEFLRSARQKKSTEEILQHLVNSGYVDEEQKISALMRLVQRDMKYLFGAEPTDSLGDFFISTGHDEVANDAHNGEEDNELGLICSRGPGKSWLWSIDPYNNRRFDFEKMPQFMAMAFALTQKHLSNLLPRNTLTELGIFFSRAEDKLHQTEQNLNTQSYSRLKDSIEFYQRGQRLQPANYDIDHLDTIYRAIIRHKQIRMKYRGNEYQLHPLGVAILLPKLYLVAIKEESVHKNITSDNASYRHFLVHKIENIQIEQKTSVTLQDFSLKEYLESGHMDVLADPADRQEYPLKIIIRPGNKTSNLISDLKENPLSPNQRITAINEQEYLLTTTQRRTIQLYNWIMNLGAECEVIEPDVVRDDISKKLQAILSMYTP